MAVLYGWSESAISTLEGASSSQYSAQKYALSEYGRINGEHNATGLSGGQGGPAKARADAISKIDNEDRAKLVMAER